MIDCERVLKVLEKASHPETLSAKDVATQADDWLWYAFDALNKGDIQLAKGCILVAHAKLGIHNSNFD